MAFNKRTWKGRQGVGLNKFSINGASPVTVVNQPDSITEVGDALSAGNLNDLEDRIYDAFDDIADGTQIVGKATADASGNVIDQTYETKADASDLKDAIRKDEARITNLEEKADPTGAYKTVNYRGTNDVPSGKAKYALVESIVGKSRAWNQLQNITDASGASWGNGTYTYADGLITINCSANGSTVNAKVCDLNFSTVSGHSYLLYAPNLPSDFIAYSSNGSFSINAINAVNFNGTMQLRCYKNGGFASAVTYTSPILVRDLTTIFPEGVPSTVAECVQKCPDLLKYDSYGYSLPSTTVSGVKGIGKNLWDEVWQVGAIASNGEITSGDRVISTNLIPILPMTDYFFRSTSAGGGGFLTFYDADAVCIEANRSVVRNASFTSPNNAYFMRFMEGSSYGSTYNHNIMICDNSITDKLYAPYMTSTLTIPEPVTLRSAGSVAEVYDLETGEKSNPLGEADLSELEWTYVSSDGGYYSATLPNTINGNPNMLCENYSLDNVAVFNMGDKTMRTIPNGIYVKDSSGTPTGTLIYALATPNDPTQLTPVIDNTILTEGGGTINTIQTQTPIIDNCLDVGYLAL